LQWKDNTSSILLQMSSMPSTLNAAPVPVIVPMDIDAESDSEAE